MLDDLHPDRGPSHAPPGPPASPPAPRRTGPESLAFAAPGFAPPARRYHDGSGSPLDDLVADDPADLRPLDATVIDERGAIGTGPNDGAFGVGPNDGAFGAWADEDDAVFARAMGEGDVEDHLAAHTHRRRHRRRRLGMLVAVLAVLATLPAAALATRDATPAVAVEVLPATDDGDEGRVRLSGWLESTGDDEPPEVRVDVDGRPAERAVANGRSRQRWEWRGPRDERGFGVTVPVPPGDHEICVVSVADARTLQCTRVTVPGPPDDGPGTTGRASTTTAPGTTVPEETTTSSTEPLPETTVPPPPTTVAPPTTPAPTRPPATTPALPAAPANTGWHGQMLAAVNAERARAGLAPVTACASLNRAAQDYAQVMADRRWFDHTGPDGSTLSSRTRAAGYTSSGGGWSVAENIAQGYGDVNAVMRGWMESSGHRANILNPRLRHLGMGWVRSGNYWVQNFGSGGTC